MALSSRRPVITGLGVISPLGLELGSFWDALREGRSGVRRLEGFDTSGLPVHIGGEVTAFEPRNYLDKKDRKRLNIMVRTFQFVAAASQLALQDAQVDKEKIDPARFGVVFGSSTIPSELNELGLAAVASTDPQTRRVDLKKWGKQGLPLIPPMWMLCHIPNMQACHVSIIQNAQGPNNTITQSDVAGALTLGEACRHIARGDADLFLTGGGDSALTPINFMRHCLFSPLSRRNQEPTKACRPFDKKRDGWVLGEGAGVLVVEALEHAEKRGAPILAEIAGFASTFDKGRSGKGLARALRQALERAGIGPKDIDHVNAQGNSSRDADAWEARAIAEVFGTGRDASPVLACKSYMGHLGASGSAVEMIASLLALKHGVVPRTLNYEEPDPACPVNVLREARQVRKPHFLKIAFTEMGQCAAIVFRKF
ncbi:MAG: beta-ketoacyl-[acyl-carrier-protein] synthase family protein [Planctomycetes bacterium]|nr:beta-ketoacyl-[acyl-carrier-protein] synthase family protein [Planctomycetota bacterium]